MSSLAISLIVTGVIILGGVLGLVLQRILPERYTMDKVRDMIGGVVGQLTLLLVLVNGLLIWTAYGVFSTQQTELQTLAARALAFLNGRAYVTPQDVKEVAHDVLQHRVTVTYEAEAENLTSRDIIQKILDTLPVP